MVDKNIMQFDYIKKESETQEEIWKNKKKNANFLVFVWKM